MTQPNAIELNLWKDHRSKKYAPISKNRLKSYLENEFYFLKLESGLRFEPSLEDGVYRTVEIEPHIFTVGKVQTHRFTLEPLLNDKENSIRSKISLPFPYLRGEHANQIRWYLTEEGLEMEGPHSFMRFKAIDPTLGTNLIEFEDSGQDFLTWTLNGLGLVIDCQPFQASSWVGVFVHNPNAVPGELLRLEFPPERGIEGIRPLDHAVKSNTPLDQPYMSEAQP
jgi:hypothetical protein